MRRGVFELATGGTLFLDELGELPLELQPKLLRVLDGHPIRRVGGERDVHVDVRLVCATNRDLPREIREGRFRLDLYHRVRVVEVSLPPLRARAGDIELLAQHFLARLASELAVPIPRLEPSALAALSAYAWPGNVRELRNALERAVVLGRGAAIEARDLPPDLVEAWSASHDPLAPSDGAPPAALDDVIRDHVVRVFRASAGNVSHCARALGISRNTLRRHLRSAGIRLANSTDGVQGS